MLSSRLLFMFMIDGIWRVHSFFSGAYVKPHWHCSDRVIWRCRLN